MQLDQKAPEAVKREIQRFHRNSCYPEALEVELEVAAKRILQAVQPVPVVTDEPEFQTAPDNGTVNEVLAYVLDCARRWEPKARIIGNARAGDIARALTATASAEPVAWQPIETAPKEGAYFIYQPAEKSGWYGLPARIVLNGDGGRRTSSHWMPLPAAPLPAQGGKADD